MVAVTLDLIERLIRAELIRCPGKAGYLGILGVMLYAEQGTTLPTQTVFSLVHELRTPLTAIIGYTDLLLSEVIGILGKTQRQFLQRIRSGVRRTETSLDNLARTAATDAEQLSTTPDSFNVVSIIVEANKSLSLRFNERALKVQLDVSPDLPLIRFDRDSFEQIVLHLLSNAWRCSKPGSAILVRAQLEKQEDQTEGVIEYLSVSVTDTCGGIAPQDQR